MRAFLIAAALAAGACGAAGAPALKKKPLGHYERQIRPGLVVYSPLEGRWVEIVEGLYDGDRLCWWKYKVPPRPGTDDPEVYMTIYARSVAEWLRDCVENRRTERKE